MDGVLNDYTETVHKHETGAPALHTVCGATYNVDSGQLRIVSVERAVRNYGVSKCGRCFDEGNGY